MFNFFKQFVIVKDTSMNSQTVSPCPNLLSQHDPFYFLKQF